MVHVSRSLVRSAVLATASLSTTFAAPLAHADDEEHDAATPLVITSSDSPAFPPAHAKAVLTETVVKPTFYYLPESCRQEAEWRMEGKALCRARGVVYDWMFKAHLMFVSLPGLAHASQVLRTFGNRANIIHPFRSIAADNRIPFGTGLYLPAYDGRRMVFEDLWIDHDGDTKDGGRVIVHDGCFYKSDTGGAFSGKGNKRIDVYLGLEKNYALYMPGGRYAHLNVDMKGVWGHPKCARPTWDFPAGAE